MVAFLRRWIQVTNSAISRIATSVAATAKATPTYTPGDDVPDEDTSDVNISRPTLTAEDSSDVNVSRPTVLSPPITVVGTVAINLFTATPRVHIELTKISDCDHNCIPVRIDG